MTYFFVGQPTRWRREIRGGTVIDCQESVWPPLRQLKRWLRLRRRDAVQRDNLAAPAQCCWRPVVAQAGKIERQDGVL